MYIYTYIYTGSPYIKLREIPCCTFYVKKSQPSFFPINSNYFVVALRSWLVCGEATEKFVLFILEVIHCN